MVACTIHKILIYWILNQINKSSRKRNNRNQCLRSNNDVWFKITWLLLFQWVIINLWHSFWFISIWLENVCLQLSQSNKRRKKTKASSFVRFNDQIKREFVQQQNYPMKKQTIILPHTSPYAIVRQVVIWANVTNST